ncbi:hypothetical protein E4K10_47630 [Streptomyces sp. T1317-0309]|nr:hypothetical protein E4K10_47630 [Streptomyces sp. T1317-0309]
MLYDTAGNLTQTTDSRGKTVSYTYDVLNRKTGQYASTVAAQTPGASGNQTAAWTYDNDNAVSGVTNRSATPPPPPPTTPATPTPPSKSASTPSANHSASPSPSRPYTAHLAAKRTHSATPTAPTPVCSTPTTTPSAAACPTRSSHTRTSTPTAWTYPPPSPPPPTVTPRTPPTAPTARYSRRSGHEHQPGLPHQHLQPTYRSAG